MSHRQRFPISPSGLVVAGFVCLSISGCFRREPIHIDSPDPAGRIPAMKLAAERSDRQVLDRLVDDLDSDDPAIRFYAIESLRRISGQTLGYRYFDDERGRAPAIARWRDFLRTDSNGVSTRPSTP
jgi:hypothetical protein